MQVKGKRPVTACEHTDRPHCAKGYCHECYFRSRTVKQRTASREYAKRKRDEKAAKKANEMADKMAEEMPQLLDMSNLPTEVTNADEMEELAKRLGIRKEVKK